MKKAAFLTIFILLSITNGFTQTYDFINEMVKSSAQDITYIFENFMSDYRVDINKFDEINFREWWESIPSSNGPKIEPFLSNYDLSHLRGDLEANRNDTLIDFNQLDDNIKKLTRNELSLIKKEFSDNSVSEVTKSKYLNKAYLNISNPVFSCSKDWAIIIVEHALFYPNVPSNGYLIIYRRNDDKWKVYHKITLWIS